jgi:hypothetical protein
MIRLRILLVLSHRSQRASVAFQFYKEPFDSRSSRAACSGPRTSWSCTDMIRSPTNSLPTAGPVAPSRLMMAGRFRRAALLRIASVECHAQLTVLGLLVQDDLLGLRRTRRRARAVRSTETKSAPRRRGQGCNIRSAWQMRRGVARGIAPAPAARQCQTSLADSRTSWRPT